MEKPLESLLWISGTSHIACHNQYDFFPPSCCYIGLTLSLSRWLFWPLWSQPLSASWGERSGQCPAAYWSTHGFSKVETHKAAGWTQNGTNTNTLSHSHARRRRRLLWLPGSDLAMGKVRVGGPSWPSHLLKSFLHFSWNDYFDVCFLWICQNHDKRLQHVTWYMFDKRLHRCVDADWMSCCFSCEITILWG